MLEPRDHGLPGLLTLLAVLSATGCGARVEGGELDDDPQLSSLANALGSAASGYGCDRR
jgi:hypothetical protein